MPTAKRVSVVLPSFNEAANLETLVTRVTEVLSTASEHTSRTAEAAPWETVIVDDGSTDTTSQIARDLSQRLPVRLLKHRQNQGLGAAMRTGLRGCVNSDTVITMDADNTQDPALIPAMLAKLDNGYDLVIASRFAPGGAEVGVPYGRKALSRAACGVMGGFAPVKGVRDYSCGYRAYRGDLIRLMIAVYGPETFIRQNSFACMVELLLRAVSLGARVAEVPLVLRYDLRVGASKMQVLRTVRGYASVIKDRRAGFPPEPNLELNPNSKPLPPRSRAIRAVNLVVAVAGLVLCAPLMGAIALSIRMTSSGPVIQREVRIGRDRRRHRPLAPGRRTQDLAGVPFEIMSFRTPQTTGQGLTRFGHLIRRYQLHRLPQLFNVLRGEMNFVGPRPERPETTARASAKFEGFSVRQTIRPGMTGLAQIYLRGEASDEELYRKMEYDLSYIAKRSVWRDLNILARTFGATFYSRHPA